VAASFLKLDLLCEVARLIPEVALRQLTTQFKTATPHHLLVLMDAYDQSMNPACVRILSGNWMVQHPHPRSKCLQRFWLLLVNESGPSLAIYPFAILQKVGSGFRLPFPFR
jgi:hypothetical protein